MRKKQIAELPPGTKFTTLVTHREGVVVEGEPRDDCGVVVRFFDLDQEKVLHPEIRVQVG